MNHVNWRSFVAALALVTVSGCAAETSTHDLTPYDEEHDPSSSAGAARQDDLSALGSIEVAPSISPAAPQAEANSPNSRELNGPRPEPWSGKPD